MNLFDIAKKTSKEIEEQIKAWNSFSRLSLTGLLWEERLSVALKNKGFINDWSPEINHRPGKDWGLTEYPYSFSCKGAVIEKDGRLKISSYRTGKQKTLKEKLDYHEAPKQKNFSHYGLIIKKKRDPSLQMAAFIDKSCINAKNLKWTKRLDKNKKTVWEGHSPHIQMKIEPSMSDQFWYWLDWNELINSNLFYLACQVRRV